MSTKTILLVICVFVFTAVSTQAKFPFPQKASYNGTIITNPDADATIQKYYEYWLKNYYEENNDLARIKWDELDKTVSEGIGYGMIIMVYMDNEKNNTREKFDKLWAYYKRFPDGNGLMNWKIQGFSNVIGGGAASDAEIDVLLALIMAYKQWGDEKYRSDARWLAGKMLQCEVNGGNQLVGGDQLGRINPSYFSIVAMKMAQNSDITPDNGNQERWKQVVNNSYSLIKKSRDQNTGYIPDWCKSDGGADGPLMGYDAIRTPWRIAWAYAWFGDADAKEICDKISATAVQQGIGKYDKNRTFTGAFMLSAMTDTGKMAWMQEKYDTLNNLSLDADVYFGQSLNVMYQLLVTGNMPNLYTHTPTSSVTAKIPGSNALSMNISYGQQGSPFQITFSLPNSSSVNLTIFDAQGKVALSVITNQTFEKGLHSVPALIGAAGQVSNGVYFACLTLGSELVTRRIVVAR
jgi:endo-1,4-beta-D-glucanase Y